jgi:hypothetical protein
VNDNKTPTTTWPELAESLYAFLTGRGATIEYGFDNMEIWVPSTAYPESPAARWKVHGTLRVRTSEPSRN